MRFNAILHAHSNWSYDGHWTLPALAMFYGRVGVRAVMMTEHDTGFDPDSFPAYRAACSAASTRRCTLIPGVEYSCPENITHILTWGLDTFLSEGRPVNETLRAVRDRGGVAILAHPVRRDAWRRFENSWIPDLSGIEIWNRKSDGICWGHEALDLIRRTGLSAMVGQDFHRLRHFYPLTHRFDLAASDFTMLEKALVRELAAGRSTPQVFWRNLLDEDGTPGPTIHPRMETIRRKLRRVKFNRDNTQRHPS